MPAFKEREHHEEVSLDDFNKDEVTETLFEDSENVDLDEDFGFSTKDMFEEDDGEIDTTVSDGSLIDDDFDDDLDNE